MKNNLKLKDARVFAAAECLLGRLDSIMRRYNHHFIKDAAVLGDTTGYE